MRGRKLPTIPRCSVFFYLIKKESPNEGTETIATVAIKHKRRGI